MRANVETAEALLAERLQLPTFPVALQLVKDTKYFIKDYQGPFANAVSAGELRLQCRVSVHCYLVVGLCCTGRYFIVAGIAGGMAPHFVVHVVNC